MMAPRIRKIVMEDNFQVAKIIRTVMPAYGAGGKGFAIHDAEVDDMFNAYASPGFAYFVCVEGGKILGGGGIAPLEGAASDVCELKKMYFLEEGRGKGLGQKLLSACLKVARQMDYKYCYLETFNTMKDAMKLYKNNGFEQIHDRLGNTGHFACDIFYQIKL